MIKRLVEADWFHHGIVAVIVLAGIVAGLETNLGVVRRHGSILHALDVLILGVFVARPFSAAPRPPPVVVLR